jgi:hypothetical protein
MRTKHIIAVLVMVAAAAGCARKTEVFPAEPRAIGGTGGKATLRVMPKFHDRYIDTCRIYIKYDTLAKPNTATSFPADTVGFDTAVNVTSIDGLPRAIFKNLKKGNYYLYGRGYDAGNDTTLVGGGPFKVVDTIERTYDLYLPILMGN